MRAKLHGWKTFWNITTLLRKL